MTPAQKALNRERAALVARLAAVDGALRLLKAPKVASVGKRHIGPKGIARIRAAQKARWQKYNKQQVELAKGK